MTGNDYQKLAMRTNDGKSTDRLRFFCDAINNHGAKDIGDVVNACLGLAGETGETVDIIKKWIFHDSDMDYDHLKKEIGDVMWYVALLCESFGFDLDDILKTNVEKLKMRYPEGFDTERSNNRLDGDV